MKPMPCIFYTIILRFLEQNSIVKNILVLNLVLKLRLNTEQSPLGLNTYGFDYGGYFIKLFDF